MKKKVEARKITADMVADTPLETLLHVEPLGMGDKFCAKLVGRVTGEYIMVSMPPHLLINEFLREGKLLTVRYMNESNVYGFRTSVISLINVPAKLLFCEYPDTLEQVQVRGSTRIACCIPVGVAMPNETALLDGMIIDISAKGCRIVLDAGENTKVSDIDEESEMDLNFYLAGSDKMTQITGHAKTIDWKGSRCYCGIKYVERSECPGMPEVAGLDGLFDGTGDPHADIEEYLQKVSSYIKE